MEQNTAISRGCGFSKVLGTLKCELLRPCKLSPCEAGHPTIIVADSPGTPCRGQVCIVCECVCVYVLCLAA